jgi:hypothetical protein
MKRTGTAKRPLRAGTYLVTMKLRQVASVLFVIAGAGLLLAACSGGSANASGSTTTSTTSGSGRGSSFAAYLTCLRSHGVNFPTGGGGFPGAGGTPPSGTPGSSPTGSTRPTIPASERTAFQKAAQACESLRPTFPNSGQGSTEFAAYRNCLKLHGVTLPSGAGGFGGGGFGGGGFGGGAPGGSTTTTTPNPTLKAAEAACANLRPKGGFGGRPGSTTTTTS